MFADKKMGLDEIHEEQKVPDGVENSSSLNAWNQVRPKSENLSR